MLRPVAGMPSRAPLWVPRTTTRTTTWLPLAEDVLDGGVRVGEGGDHAGQHPRHGGTALDLADRAAVALNVPGQVAGGVVAVVLVDDVLEERLDVPYVGRYGPAAVE